MPKRHHHKPSRLPQFLAIIGVALLVLAVFVFLEKLPAAIPTIDPNEPSEAPLDRALTDYQPTLTFKHSNYCRQCLIMLETVNQVYPEFSTTVSSVDVNVYDDNNSKLLKRIGLQLIPMLIFYDRNGSRAITPDHGRRRETDVKFYSASLQTASLLAFILVFMGGIVTSLCPICKPEINSKLA
ncbi:MAG: hypothetical protein A2029_13550 [Chloroflexi bacterium RBG_19FT_COMBO_47_9]|nr:MAG: hypothetical protein A2029_13550 [Chloroflexi bacterium RBG_19FT_COMBO_47_9]